MTANTGRVRAVYEENGTLYAIIDADVGGGKEEDEQEIGVVADPRDVEGVKQRSSGKRVSRDGVKWVLVPDENENPVA
jgi:hypothetical protein